MTIDNTWQERYNNCDYSRIDPDRLQQLIDVMQRVKDQKRKLNMYQWQNLGALVKTETEMHECGMSACLGGWLGVSPEFQTAGGEVTCEGAPTIGSGDEYSGANAIYSFLIHGRLSDDDLWVSHVGDLLARSIEEENGLSPGIDDMLERLEYIQYNVESSGNL